MPQPHSRFSRPASVYITVSWSGEISRPWCSRSSAVLTTIARSGPRIAWRPWARRAPPTPPARRTTRPGRLGRMAGSPAEEGGDLRHPVDRLDVVGRGHPDDDRGEAQVEIGPDGIGDEIGPAEQVRHRAGMGGPVRPDQPIPGGRGRSGIVADDDREADRAFDGPSIAAHVGAVLLEDAHPFLDLVEVAARVPGVAVASEGPERLPRAGPADEDRQPPLDREGPTDRV